MWALQHLELSSLSSEGGLPFVPQPVVIAAIASAIPIIRFAMSASSLAADTDQCHQSIGPILAVRRRTAQETVSVMRASAVALALLLLVTPRVSYAAEAHPQGKNCDLAEPPADAGEETNHGMVLRVYPRAKDIGPNYSGCQLLMMQSTEKWIVISYTEVIAGDPIRVWSEFEPDPGKLACRFKAGKLVSGNEDVCPAPEFLLLRSLEPGCVSAIREQANRGGLGTSRPANCDYD